VLTQNPRKPVKGLLRKPFTGFLLSLEALIGYISSKKRARVTCPFFVGIC
jgi:hypothetical protein